MEDSLTLVTQEAVSVPKQQEKTDPPPRRGEVGDQSWEYDNEQVAVLVPIGRRESPRENPAQSCSTIDAPLASNISSY